MKLSKIFAALLLVLPLLVGGLAGAAGDTNGDIVKFSGDIVIPADQTVNGSVVAISGNIEVLGTVNGNVVAVMGNVTIDDSAVVRGDAVAVLGNLKLQNEGSVYGNRVAVVGQGFRNIPVHNWSWRLHRPHLRGFHFGAKTFGLVFQVAMTALLIAIAPQHVVRIKSSISSNFVAAGAIGLGTILASSALIFITALTIIGIPLAILLAALLGLVCLVGRYLGGAAIGLLIGQAVFKGHQSQMNAAIVGSLIAGAILMVPFTGLLSALFSLIALGGVIVTRMGTKGEIVNA